MHLAPRGGIVGTGIKAWSVRGRRKTLRVALVAPPYFDVPPVAYGGVESVVADLTDALVRCGHTVTVIGAGRAGTTGRFLPVWERTVPERLGEPTPR
jgi:hypothetical protein